MACEQFKTTLGGHHFNYTQLSARKSVLLKLRISKVFSEALPMLVGGLGKSDAAQMKLFASAITVTMKSATPEEITDLIFDVVDAVQIDDQAIDSADLFAGDLVGLYTLFYWTLKKEYGSFLGVLIDVLGLRSVKKKRTPKHLKSVSQT